MPTPTPPWPQLAAQLTGELNTDEAHRILFSTDASVYRERPLAVAFPASEADVVACVAFCRQHKVGLTPRAGGTSLAGQAIGDGLIVDVSKHLRNILEINTEEGYAIVEPGVIRDQLNAALAPLGYWFGPNTSTANRCTLGGMFGNNSCGSTSITVGSTREHVLEARVVLADATVHDFGARPQEQSPPSGGWGEQSPRRQAIQTYLTTLLGNEQNRAAIRHAFPKQSVNRRNTGYALDLLAEQSPFTPGGPPFNLCTLLAGSEGTLGFTTQLKVRILPLPPAGSAILCLHYTTIDAAMRATQAVMAHQPFMCEVMDDTILKLAQQNPDQRKNSAFVVGMPRALLLVEFRAATDAAAVALAEGVVDSLKSEVISKQPLTNATAASNVRQLNRQSSIENRESRISDTSDTSNVRQPNQASRIKPQESRISPTRQPTASGSSAASHQSRIENREPRISNTSKTSNASNTSNTSNVRQPNRQSRIEHRESRISNSSNASNTRQQNQESRLKNQDSRIFYAAPILPGPTNAKTVWSLRSAGLGILGNMAGDAKAVACIEDTAVALEDLADYITEVEALMLLYQQNPVYYAHAGAGEIHLRPVLNLKTTAGREDFFRITRDVAKLVKKYRGSLSGEHGDGRVRAPFLPAMLGPEVYQMLLDLKQAFDPDNIFNPGKIVAAPPMNESLRYEADEPTPDYATALDWSADGGLLRAAEKCNGSGDCRKMDGGAMCPSYRALLSEQHSTRGRANTLREVLTRNQHDNSFDHPALAESLDLCLSCKACTSECPSSVDMTNLKAEYLHQRNKKSLRTRLIAANEDLYGLGGKVPALANLALKIGGPLMKRLAGIAPERSLPAFPKQSLRDWFVARPPTPARRPSVAQLRSSAERVKTPSTSTRPTSHLRRKQRSSRRTSQGSADELAGHDKRTIYLFGDEFVNLQDVPVGQATIQLLEKLGYTVRWPDHATSGRAQLSKGLLNEARDRAAKNVSLFAGMVSADAPLVGIEPSAILGFRDEYPKLLRGDLAEQARSLAPHTFTLDEFLFREFDRGRLSAADFGPAPAELVLHVHCHEKALGEAGKCAVALSLPANFNVRLLDSGCCGMAGSFGYEAEHYELSKTIAEQSLLRHLRGLPPRTIVVASGTSCRHQVKDLLDVRALSTAEALLRSWPA